MQIKSYRVDISADVLKQPKPIENWHYRNTVQVQVKLKNAKLLIFFSYIKQSFVFRVPRETRFVKEKRNLRDIITV
jgi:hypothetical protein